jgi:transcriptional antiterminator NusG
MEKAVERNITERIVRAGMESIWSISVPTEEVVEQNGRKDDRASVFPGYVLVEMVMDELGTW